MTLKHIFIYPVKSLGGIEVSSAMMEVHGLQYDRRWMLVDEKGKFVTQRKDTQLTQVLTEISDDYLILKKKGHSDFSIPLKKEFNGDSEEVKVWSDIVDALDEGEEVSRWLHSAIGLSCRLYRLAPDAIRRSSIPFRKDTKKVSFADSQPILIANEKSLEELNSRLKSPVMMSRFRANFVVDGNTPFEEDNWKYFTIGKTRFKVMKACGRCNVINIDQQTGETNNEPFEVLSTYRFFNKNVNFGMRSKLDSEGSAGAKIEKGANVIVETTL